MVAGFERYFLIVRCFRDEDLRKDRQPEFTQIDIETSFLDRDELLSLIEGMVAEIVRRIHDVELARPFPRLTYAQAMERFGSDKPDLRFGMEQQDVTALFRDGEFQAFRQVAEAGGGVKAVRVPRAGGLTRQEGGRLGGTAENLGGQGGGGVKGTQGRAQSAGPEVPEPGQPGLAGPPGAAAW